MNLPSGKYQYVHIDLTENPHVKMYSPVFWKNLEQSEVTSKCTALTSYAGVCLPELDINDEEKVTIRKWGWRWNFWPKRIRQKLGPIRYFFIHVS